MQVRLGELTELVAERGQAVDRVPSVRRTWNAEAEGEVEAFHQLRSKRKVGHFQFGLRSYLKYN